MNVMNKSWEAEKRKVIIPHVLNKNKLKIFVTMGFAKIS